jgi:hypothetical protein
MGIGAAILGAGALAGGAALGSGIIQGNAANKATNTQLGIYQQNQQLLNPYVQGGLGAYNTLNGLLGVGAPASSSYGSALNAGFAAPQPQDPNALIAPSAGGPQSAPALSLQGFISTNIAAGNYPQNGQTWQQMYAASPASQQRPINLPQAQPTSTNDQMMNTLSNLPGYEFTINQGLKSTQNGYAARGLADSGAALKGAANYATGLANSGWNTYANALQNSANTGMQAGSSIAGVGQQTGLGVASSQIGAGNAYAGGTMGAANSIGNALYANALFGNSNNSAVYSPYVGFNTNTPSEQATLNSLNNVNYLGP